MGAIEGYCRRCLGRVAFGEEPADAPVEPSPADSAPGPGARGPGRLGRYELLEEIGHGGMGIVYRARQAGLDREVALKVLRQGPFAAGAELARFRREAAAAARLRHPNIVAVFEEGEVDGHAYFSMELVRGQSLANETQNGPLEPGRAARYVSIIAAAIAAAHAAGVLHRDLKPANVLIDQDDEPRVTDFGLAKRLDLDDATVTQGIVGSPGYMAPEQADPQRGTIGVASDVYSLGALLYHLLTGRPPFAGASVAATLTQILQNDPVPPRQLNPGVPADLETICLKCLAKSPGDRYATAAALADDLARLREGQPIVARPIGSLERLWRWSRRQPVIAGLTGGVLLLLVVVAVGSSLAALRIEAAREAAILERRRAVEANAKLTETVRLLELQRAEDLLGAGQSPNAMAHWADMVRRDPSNHIAASRLVSALIHRDNALLAVPPMEYQGPILALEVHRSGVGFVAGSRDGTARLWDVRSGRAMSDVLSHDSPVRVARYARNGEYLATGTENGAIQLWHYQTGRPIGAPFGHQRAVVSLDFHPTEALLLSGSEDGTARLWSIPDGHELRALNTTGSGITVVAFSPDGTRFVAGSSGGAVRVWRTDPWKELWRSPIHRTYITAARFSADGTRVLTASRDGTARLWEAETGREAIPALHHDNWVLSAEFSSGGSLILTGCQDGWARFWRATNGQPWGVPLKHDGAVRAAVFGARSARVATASLDVTARLWEPNSGELRCQPLWHGEMVTHVSFAVAASRLVTGSADARVRVWDIQHRRYRPTVVAHGTNSIFPIDLSPDGRQLVTGSDDGTARRWDLATGEGVGVPVEQGEKVLAAAFSPDGQWLATGGITNVRIWKMVGGQTVLQMSGETESYIRQVQFDPSSRVLLTVSKDGAVRLWDARSGQAQAPLLAEAKRVDHAEFSPDGTLVATGSSDETARVWRADTGAPVCPPLSHRDKVEFVTFSPDQRRLLTASSDNHARLWDFRADPPTARTMQHARGIVVARISASGRWIVTASLDRTARLWDAETGLALGPPLAHQDFVGDARFSPDERRLVTACRDGTIRLWDVGTGRALSEALPCGGTADLTQSRFSMDGRRVVAATVRSGVAIWDFPPAPVPVPAWFAAFAEGVGGLRISAQGNPELAPRTAESEYAANPGLIPGDDYYAAVARWLVSKPSARSASPWTSPGQH